jgi:hypothetical protein
MYRIVDPGTKDRSCTASTQDSDRCTTRTSSDLIWQLRRRTLVCYSDARSCMYRIDPVQSRTAARLGPHRWHSPQVPARRPRRRACRRHGLTRPNCGRTGRVARARATVTFAGDGGWPGLWWPAPTRGWYRRHGPARPRPQAGVGPPRAAAAACCRPSACSSSSMLSALQACRGAAVGADHSQLMGRPGPGPARPSTRSRCHRRSASPHGHHDERGRRPGPGMGLGVSHGPWHLFRAREGPVDSDLWFVQA